MNNARLGLMIVGLVASGGLAIAGPSAEIYVEATTPKVGPPRLEATVVGGPFVRAGTITIRDGRDPAAPSIEATSVRPFIDSDQPIAIAFVINGQELWIGNDDFETDDNARYMGVLNSLEHGLDMLGLSKLGPRGSEVTLVSYATGAQILAPWSPLADFKGRMLGTQHDYRNKIGTDMVQGIELGLSQLLKTTAPLRVLIVIGDGSDTNDEAAVPHLAELKKQARQAGIQTFGIIYKSVVSANTSSIRTMIPTASTVNSVDGITSSVASILGRIADRYYVTFADDRLPWDGRNHDFVMRINGEDQDEVTMAMPAIRATSTPWWRWTWWQQLAVGAALLGLLTMIRWRITAASIRQAGAHRDT
jgi:hypothetical protein